MKRDIKNINRILDDKKNNDIIWKKAKLMEMFKEDPDLAEILGWDEVLHTEKDKEKYIIPWLKLNGIQKEVRNYVMFDIDDTDVSYTNNVIKNQFLIIMCLVHEDNMETEYGIPRTDLLDYIVKDLLCWTNALGMQLKCVNDFQDIIDSKYYARTIKFKIQEINNAQGGGNKYDRFQKL